MFRKIQNGIFEINLVERIWCMFNKILNNLVFAIVGDWEAFMEKCIANHEQIMDMIVEVANLFKPKPLS